MRKVNLFCLAAKIFLCRKLLILPRPTLGLHSNLLMLMKDHDVANAIGKSLIASTLIHQLIRLRLFHRSKFQSV